MKKALEVRNIWICFNRSNKSSINSVFFEEAITFTSINVRVHTFKNKKRREKRVINAIELTLALFLLLNTCAVENINTDKLYPKIHMYNKLLHIY